MVKLSLELKSEAQDWINEEKEIVEFNDYKMSSKKIQKIIFKKSKKDIKEYIKRAEKMHIDDYEIILKRGR